MRPALRAQVPPSATMTMNSLAIQKKQKGEYVYNFATGDPILPNHPKIIQAAIDTVKAGFSPYPAVAGTHELRSAVCQWMNQSYQTQFSPSQSIVTCGGKFALYALAQALLNPGDEAIIIAPYWVSYPGIVQLAEGKPLILETTAEKGWKAEVRQIEQLISPKVKFLLLNNGSNPTGALYKPDELKEILVLCKKANILLISDEVYSEIIYDGQSYTSCGSFRDFQDHVVIIQSCSKNFAMAGWRVGFAFGPEWVIKLLIAIQGQSTTGTSIQSQRAALAAVQNASEVAKYVRDEMQKRRDLFHDTFQTVFHRKLPKPPSAVYYFLPLSDFNCPHADSVAFCEKTLEQHNVALVPGVAFGKEGYVRFSFSETAEDIVKGLKTLSH
jgi:aspartate aminotransferase